MTLQQKKGFTAPDFSKMLFNMNPQFQNVQVAQINPADFEKRYAEFLDMDAEDRQDYIEALQTEAQSNENARNYLNYIGNQQAAAASIEALEAGKKKGQKNTIIFVVILVVIAGVGGYFLFKK